MDQPLIPNFQPPLHEQPRPRSCPACHQPLQPNMTGACPSCGAALPADPMVDGPWRTRRRVVARLDSSFPLRCIKCNQPASEVIIQNLQVAITFSLSPRTCRIQYSLCPVCRRRQRMMRGLVVALTIAGWVWIFLPVPLWYDYRALGIVLILAGAALGASRLRAIRARRMDREYVWIDGPGRPFRDSLPPAPALIDR